MSHTEHSVQRQGRCLKSRVEAGDLPSRPEPVFRWDGMSWRTDHWSSFVRIQLYTPPLKVQIVEIENPSRSWQEIAQEASHEKDSKRLQQLSQELEHALDERAKKLHLQTVPDSKKQSA